LAFSRAKEISCEKRKVGKPTIMIINKISILLVVIPVVLTIVIAGIMTTTHNANALTTKDGREIYVPGAYIIHNDGTVTYDKFDGPASHPPDTPSIASKSDSPAGANSKTEVKCLMFCAAFSNTNAGSAASNSDSDSSKINSPSAVSSSSSNPITTTATQVKSGPSSDSSPVECIYNTGSSNDEGYSKGYVDGNRDSVGLNGHGYDNSVHHGDKEFKTGYKDGYNAGFSDGKKGINKSTC
jgi:hypothetical protein